MTQRERRWRKSRRSGTASDCVEVADEPGGNRLVRNSNYPEHGEIPFTAEGWTAFLKAVKAHDFAHQPGGIQVELLADGGARMTDGKVEFVFTPGEWEAFEGGVNDGEFD